MFDGCGYAAIVVAGGFVPAKAFQFGNAVSHDHRNAREGEHFQIVVVIADGEHFFASDAAKRGPFGERSAFGTYRIEDVDHGKIPGFVYGCSKSELVRKCGAAKRGFGVAHGSDASAEHHLKGIFGEAALERIGEAEKFAIAGVIGGADRVIGIHGFEHDLIFAAAVEDDSRGITPGTSEFEDARGGFAGEQVAQVSLAVMGANEGAVADDHSERRIDLASDGEGEIVATAGYQGDFDATEGGGSDRGAIGLWKLPAAVQEGAVDVQGDQADAHGVIVPWTGRRLGDVFGKRTVGSWCPPPRGVRKL